MGTPSPTAPPRLSSSAGTSPATRSPPALTSSTLFPTFLARGRPKPTPSCSSPPPTSPTPPPRLPPSTVSPELPRRGCDHQWSRALGQLCVLTKLINFFILIVLNSIETITINNNKAKKKKKKKKKVLSLIPLL